MLAAILSLAAVLAIHEAGHVAFARALGVPVRGFKLHWRGLAALIGRDDLILTRRVRALIAAGGPAASLLLMRAAADAGLAPLAVASLVLAVLNLIPAGPSDGRKIWREIRRRVS